MPDAHAHAVSDLLYDPLPGPLERVFFDNEPEVLRDGASPPRSGPAIFYDPDGPNVLFADGRRIGTPLLEIECKDVSVSRPIEWWEVVYEPNEAHS